MNALRSLEQNRAEFAYNLLKSVLDLRDKEPIGRINGILKIIFNKDIEIIITSEEFEELRTSRKKEKIEEKSIFDNKFQQILEDKLSSYIGKSPTMLLVNGLGNTMVFYISKIGSTPKMVLENVNEFKKAVEEWRKKPEDNQALEKLEKSKSNLLDTLKPDKVAYLILYKAINDWLREKGIIGNADDVLKWFKDDKTSSIDVLHATEETIELLKWMKRFSDAMLEKGE